MRFKHILSLDVPRYRPLHALIASLSPLIVVFLVLPPIGQVHSDGDSDHNQQHKDHNSSELSPPSGEMPKYFSMKFTWLHSRRDVLDQ